MTYTGKLGAGREKAQAFLGAYYGIPLSRHQSTDSSTTLQSLYSLEHSLLSRYSLAREQLSEALERVGEGAQQAVRGEVREKYQTCFQAQTSLARLRRYVRCVESECGGAPGVIGGGVVVVEEEVAGLDYGKLSLSQLYRLAGCLVNTMLVLCGPSRERDGGEDSGRPQLTGIYTPHPWSMSSILLYTTATSSSVLLICSSIPLLMY